MGGAVERCFSQAWAAPWVWCGVVFSVWCGVGWGGARGAQILRCRLRRDGSLAALASPVALCGPCAPHTGCACMQAHTLTRARTHAAHEAQGQACAPVRDLLQRLDLVHRDEVAVQVHELDGHLLELALRQQVALDALQRLVRVVVRLQGAPAQVGGGGCGWAPGAGTSGWGWLCVGAGRRHKWVGVAVRGGRVARNGRHVVRCRRAQQGAGSRE